jgi:hypothetical protein
MHTYKMQLLIIANIIRHITSRRLRWAEHVARMGEESKRYRVLVGKPEGKKPLGRTRRRWEDGIRMDLRKFGWGCRMDPVGSRQGPVAGSCNYGDETSESGATESVSQSVS